MKINELHNQPVKPDTYEASMALNQLLKIGKHAIKIQIGRASCRERV